MLLSIPGELYAITAALLWAFASLLFKQLSNRINPLELNLLKGLLGILFISCTLLIRGNNLLSMPVMAVILLLISGAIGIGLGDSAYFLSLKEIGPRRALVISTLAPPLTALIAFVFLGENLHWQSWVGIAITALGVIWVVSEPGQGTDGGMSISGIIWGIIYSIAQATGAVISRQVFIRWENVGSLESALVRLAAGVFALIFVLLALRKPIGIWIKTPERTRLFFYLGLAGFLGTFLAIWLQQAAFQNTQVGIASTLLATSPIFILPMTALQGEKITLRSVIGSVVALAGIALLFGVFRG